MRTALVQLAAHPKANSCDVKVTVEWNARLDPHSVPMSFAKAADGMSPLQNHTRLVSQHSFTVLGVNEEKDRTCVISHERLSGVYRLFPKDKRFEIFESNNPKTSSPMRVLYQVTNQITSI